MGHSPLGAGAGLGSLPIALLVLVSGCGTDVGDGSTEQVRAADGQDVGVMGGPATAKPLEEAATSAEDPLGAEPLAETAAVALTSFAEVVIRGAVTAVLPAELNTPDGKWTSGLPPKQARRVHSDLVTLTPIQVSVAEAVGARPSSPLRPVAGETLTFWLLGGDVTYVLSPADAAAINLRIPSEAEDGPPEQTLGDVPTEPVELIAGMGHAAQLSVGDDVVLFLSYADLPLAGSDDSKRVLVAIALAGSGAFVTDGAGIARPAVGGVITASVAELEAFGRTLNGADVPATDPTSADLIAAGVPILSY